MRLARKLTIAIVLGILAVLAVHSYIRIRRETGMFETDMRRDGHIIGRVLKTAAVAVWRTDGEAHAKRLIAEVNESESNVTIRWISVGVAAGAPDAPRVAAEELEAIGQGREVVRKHFDPNGTEHLVTYAPVRMEGRIAGAIEVSESMAGERAYLRRAILNVIVASVALALVCGAMTIGLGLFFVGRPMRSLIEQARLVGAGDLSQRLHFAQRDEIGELAGEMNTMCDRLVEANRRAEAEVARRIDALEQLRHADRLATVGKLASGIAHELGAPLQVVSARAKMIADGDVAGAETAEYGRIIHEQAGRMAALIRQLLDFARRKVADKAPADLAELARNTCRLLMPLADKRGVTIDLEERAGREQGDAPFRAMIDAEQIQQALTNLIVNGIQAMPRGGALSIRLLRERATPPPGLGTGDRDYLRLDVEDDGEGMSPATIERAFEPFFTTKPPGEGTGLGLAVAQEIARGHKGWITARSRMTKGSCFSMYLPEDTER